MLPTAGGFLQGYAGGDAAGHKVAAVVLPAAVLPDSKGVTMVLTDSKGAAAMLLD
jgi:hypothetical protein